MDKKWATVTIIVLLLILISYVVFDMAFKKEIPQSSPATSEASVPADQWTVTRVFAPAMGQLNAIATSENGNIFIGGESFVACFDTDFKLIWELKTEMPVAALTSSGANLYAAMQGTILVLSLKGEKIDEWGPFENNSIITSLSANETYVALADAGNKLVFILDKNGVVKYLVGGTEDPFNIPSFYFDVALNDENNLFVANTGQGRIEKRNIDGKMLSFFGEHGTGPDAFCGCCNPSHFIIIPGGFITSEKGINRIKILNGKGEFVEFVSSVNNFVPPLPLDIASPDGKIIYGANPADSKLYVFERKSPPTPLKGG
jgi:hypothetical protein